ncbi:hypothetical protein Bca101_077054 [Brassica carinata]
MALQVTIITHSLETVLWHKVSLLKTVSSDMKVGSSMAPYTHSNNKAMFRVADQKRVICFTHDSVLSGPEENSPPNFVRPIQNALLYRF